MEPQLAHLENSFSGSILLNSYVRFVACLFVVFSLYLKDLTGQYPELETVGNA